VEFQRLATAADPAERPVAEIEAADTAAPHISSAPNGVVRYRDRRLVVLYFDLSAMPPNDQMRAYSAAQKFIDARMDPSVLVAIIAFQGGAVKVKSDFTDNHSQLHEAITRLIFNDDLDGDGIPDTPDVGTAFGQDDAEFNIFNTDRQLSALQTAVNMLQPLQEQKSLISPAGCGSTAWTTRRSCAPRRTRRCGPTRRFIPSMPAGLWRILRWATPRGSRQAVSECSAAVLRATRWRAFSGLRTPCTPWRKTPAAPRCSTTTICRWAS
jgi:hypothetical protein